jgi:hypothetical protein
MWSAIEQLPWPVPEAIVEAKHLGHCGILHVELGNSSGARALTSPEKVILLDKRVLEVTRRTKSRSTARVRRYVVETEGWEGAKLQIERVVIKRRRQISDKINGKILTEMTVEVIETAKLLMVNKWVRLRRETVVRTKHTH